MSWFTDKIDQSSLIFKINYFKKMYCIKSVKQHYRKSVQFTRVGDTHMLAWRKWKLPSVPINAKIKLITFRHTIVWKKWLQRKKPDYKKNISKKKKLFHSNYFIRCVHVILKWTKKWSEISLLIGKYSFFSFHRSWSSCITKIL